MRLNVKYPRSLSSSSPPSSSGADPSSDLVSVEASSSDSVESLYRKVEQKLNLDSAPSSPALVLVFAGKKLKDGTPLSSYKLTDGSKLHLVVLGNNASSASSTSSSALSAAGKPQPQLSIEAALLKNLRKHFKTEEEAKKVAAAFKKIFFGKLNAMNYDDIERFCAHWNSDQKITF